MKSKKPKINWSLVTGVILLVVSLALIIKPNELILNLETACIGFILMIAGLYVIIKNL